MTEKFANGPPVRPETKEHLKAIAIVLIAGSAFGLGFFGWLYHILVYVLAVIGLLVVAAAYGAWKYHRWQMKRRQPIPMGRQYPVMPQATAQPQLAPSQTLNLQLPANLSADDTLRVMRELGGR